MEESIYYLSGPMSGIKDHNFPLFAKVAETLRADGFQIRSPYESQAITDHGTELQYHEYIKKDIEIMMECNSIIMLPGWMNSKGARIEINLAMDLCFDIYRLFSVNLSSIGAQRGYEPALRIARIDEGLYEYDRF